MKTTWKLVLGFALGLTLMGAAPLASAQDDPSNKIIPSLEYQQADVREALRALFKSAGNPSYVIANDVQGSITVSLKNQTFETCLRNILSQVDATYRIEGGVYNIVRKEVVQAPNTLPEFGGTTSNNSGKVIRRIKIRSADPAFIAAMLGADKGTQNYFESPEISTSMGGGMGGMGGGMGGMGGGMGMGGMGMGGMGGGMGGMGMGGMGGGMGGMGGGMGGFGGGRGGGMGGGGGRGGGY